MTRADRPLHPDLPAEQRHLDETVRKMIDRIDFLEDRDRNSGADLETSLTMADNAEEQAAMLSVHVHEPYFGSLGIRIAGRDRQVYVGKHAFGDFGGDCSVIDWKSDVGSLFYGTETEWVAQGRKAVKGTVWRKRQIDVKRKKVLDVVDLFGGAEGQEAETGGREQVLVERLSEASTAGMRDVIQTLQPEQNAAMRAQPGVPLVVQGSAGSGKTTIGFHRLAWMADASRGADQAAPGRCLVLVPNQVLAAYAARVLPSLDLQGVQVTTPEAWMVSFLGIEKLEVTDRTLQLILQDSDAKRRAAAWRRSKLLGSLKLLEVARRHLQGVIRSRLKGVHLKVALDLGHGPKTFELSPEQVAAMLEKVFQREPLMGYKAAFREAVKAEAALSMGVGDESEELSLSRQLDSELVKLQGKVFGSTVPILETQRLLSTRAMLEQAGEGLLNAREMAVILSDPLSGFPRPRRSNVDVSELPLILAMQALLGGIGRRDGHALERYDHVVLDEGQDFSPLFYSMIGRAVRPGHITVLGDLSQAMHGYKGIDRWDELEGALPGAQVMTLSRTYRSTREISRVTAAIAASYSRVIHGEHVDRSGVEPRAVVVPGTPRKSPAEWAEQVAPAVALEVKAAQAAGHANVALVTRRVAEAEALSEALQAQDVHALPIARPEARYEGGVVSIPVSYAKGLEFDSAVLVGADAATYDPKPEYERRLLYVAASRGLHWLSFVAVGELHPAIAGELVVAD